MMIRLTSVCRYLLTRTKAIQQTRRTKQQTRYSLTPSLTTMSDQQAKPPLQFYRRTLPSTCTSFSSKRGKQIFSESLLAGQLEGYFSLAAQFRTQDEPAFCGLSTLVMVLNTLEVDPKKVWKGPWRWYHESMLDCCVPLEMAEKTGITLNQFACLARCNTLEVELTRVDSSSSVETFREAVRAVTSCDDHVIVVSYSRQVLGQTGDGHFSPIGGFHPENDMVLVLDTARFKYPPHWVSLPLLFDAMKGIDKDTGLSRGYLMLSKGSNRPLLLFRLPSALSIPLPLTGEKQSKGLQACLKVWNDWLMSKNNLEGEEVLEQTVLHLVQAAGHLGDNDCLLTTQVDMTCRDGLSEEHLCMVEEIIDMFETLPLKSQVQSILSKQKDQHKFSKLGQAIVSKSCQLLTNEDTENSGKPPMKRDCRMCHLETPHFVTALLLAWPYYNCDQSNGALLQRLAVAQLSQTSAILQSEIAQLKQQLSSVLWLMENCTACIKCI